MPRVCTHCSNEPQWRARPRYEGVTQGNGGMSKGVWVDHNARYFGGGMKIIDERPALL